MFPEQHARLLFRQEPQNFLTNIWQPFSALALTAPPEMCMIWHQRSAGPASEISVESAANAGETEKRVNRVNPASQGNEQIYIYTVSDHSGFQIVHFWTGLSKSFAIFQAHPDCHCHPGHFPPECSSNCFPVRGFITRSSSMQCRADSWRVKLHSALPPCPNPMAANCTSQVSPWSIRRVSLGD